MKKVLKITANVAAWLLVIFALIITILVFSSTNNGGVPNLLGFIPLTIESQSMSPTFNEGDLIISQQIDDVSTLQKGDVITFWTIIEGRKVKNTHRIVKVNEVNGSYSFITRGDNNPIDDEIPAYQADIIGKWTNIRLTGAGTIMAFLRTKLGFFVCILIPMAIFFLIELYKFIVTVIKVKQPAVEPPLDEEEIKRRAIEEYLAAQKEKEKKEEPKQEVQTTKEDSLTEIPSDTALTEKAKEAASEKTDEAEKQTLSE